MSLFSIFLAILGLGFLVFIHELGHYWVARKKGMRVEAFAIGFGKPIFSWVRDGVKWQICMLPFGGYVKIAGMQKENNLEPSQIPDGFYGKKPWARIQVAFAGPLVNICFSLLVFSFLWFSGGREKPFAEFTHRIGWVDPKSTLYSYGVRPGDAITKYDRREFTGFKDLMIASIMKGDETEIQGTKINYITGEEKPYAYTLKTYENPESFGKEKLSTIGVISPARYLMYNGPNLIAGSPMKSSGIQAGDRILWADGEILFSHEQLSSLTNESTAFLTVKRGDKIFQTKVPRVQLGDLHMSPVEKGEIDDWQHEAGLKEKFQDLYFIPYNLSPSLRVEGRLSFIDEKDQIKAFEPCKRCNYFLPLEEGDEILAVDGGKVISPYELLTKLQQRKMLIIVERDPTLSKIVSWKKASQEFTSFDRGALQALIASIGSGSFVESKNLHLLAPVAPKPLNDFPLDPEKKALLSEEIAKTRKQIEAIDDPSQKDAALEKLQQSQKRLVLGVPLVDRETLYNPSPLAQFKEVLKDTYRTLTGLFSGAANPKYVAGPVGIVQIVQQSWMVGFKEALFWMALISLNLGLINLLPLPVLDGGHIVFSFIEAIIKRPIRAKTMEKLIVPFVVFLIGFFLFVTYHDLTRLFSKFF